MDYQNEINWLLKEKYDGMTSEEAEEDIERIKSGEPVAYVIGFVDFLGCKIDLSQKTLIPRPETEFWVEQVIKVVQHSVLDTMIYHSGTFELKCLDMFTGSGCIGIAVLKTISTAMVDFVDSDSRAIKQVEINCKLNNIEASRYQIIKSNMFEHIGKTYDYIFTNPPYIPESEKEDVGESVLAHEPHEALFGGEDGLKFIEVFLDEAPKHLTPSGKVYMEFGVDQKDAIEKILETKNYSKINFHQDQFKKWRYLILEK